MKRNIFLLMLCLFGLIGAMAQTKTATGVVTDQAGEAVIGASVIVKVPRTVPLRILMVNLP